MQSILYKDYNDFISKYTKEQFFEEQDKLNRNYFAEHTTYGNYTMEYEQLFGFKEAEDCDPELFCC